MSYFYPRPTETQIFEEVETIHEPCPACDAPEIQRYTALRSTGWHKLTRCRACLHVVASEPTNQSYVPLTSGWPTSAAG